MARYLSISSVTTMLSRIWAQFVSNDYLIDAAPDRKYYEILLSQASTDAPTAIILNNTVGVVPTLAYTSAGLWTITATGKWTADKTLITVGTPYTTTGDKLIGCVRTSANVLTVTQTVAGVATDVCTKISIKVEIMN